jgi:hypothetical protein
MSKEFYASYLLRFWRDNNEEMSGVSWLYEVELVQTDQKWQFNDLRDMLRFTQEKVGLPSSNNPD